MIEVMVVVVVLGVMAAIIAPKVFDKPDQVRQNTAQLNLNILAEALEMYRLEQRSYPTLAQGLSALATAPAELESPYPPNGYVRRSDLEDPWGNPYVYVFPGERGPFELISYGRDGTPGGSGYDADLRNRD